MTIDALLTKWLAKEQAGERAEYQQFLTELMQALGVPTPGDDGVPVAEYQFEAPVKSAAVYGGTGTKRIDLYKRNCFISGGQAEPRRPGYAVAAPPNRTPPKRCTTCSVSPSASPLPRGSRAAGTTG